MASIGGVTFLRIDRDASPPGENVERVTRPQVDGTAVRRVGRRGDTFELVGVIDLENEADYQTLVNSSLALQGTLVTYVNNRGTTLTGILVERARVREDRDIRGAVGGLASNATIVARMSFTCVDTNV